MMAANNYMAYTVIFFNGGNKMYLGIDISVHNGNVNVKKVKESGYKFIFVRAGYGQNNIDQKFINNATACVNSRMSFGIYWFSYAYTVEMARQEAKHAIEAVKKYSSRCPIAYDLEYDSVRYARTKGVNITKALATAMAKAFIEEVKSAGYIPVLYTNNDYEKNYFDMDQFDCHIWYARYKNIISSTEKAHADILQKSSVGRVQGISGNVDINEFYTDFEKKCVKADTKKICNVNIMNFQNTANADGYRDEKGNKLLDDGIDGSHTQYVRKQVILKALNTINGYKVSSQGELVIWWQTRLNEMGFETAIDGKYGADTRDKTMKMQEKYNLSVDGIAGYNSIYTAFYN